MTTAPPVALALDLGTTRVKLAPLDADGALGEVRTRPAPRPSGAGLVRTLDADSYRLAAEALFAGAPEGVPLGIASQRSSFLLWDRAGKPVTPLVSWQDRSAEPWCTRKREELGESADGLADSTGLLLSPHYAGPKLAALFEARPDLHARTERGELLFGTLETYLIWHWSGGAAHETDLSMAARTLLVALDSGRWDPALCQLFGVPPRALGRIAPSHGHGELGRATELSGPVGRRALRASLADQPAGLVASLGAGAGGALVNLGTGVFCLRSTGARLERRRGYLSGPLLSGPGGARYALEGTVNGGGATADRFAPGPTALPARDPTPQAFCLPDENGVGAPHWRAEQGFVLSGGDGLAPADQRRAVLEGILFRVHATLEDLGASEGRVLVSGGLSNDPFVPAALASTLARSIEVLEEGETTLLGAAQLAAEGGPNHLHGGRTRSVDPVPQAAWLADKSLAWRAWVGELLGRGPR